MLRVMAVGVTRARVDVVCDVQHISRIKNQHNILESKDDKDEDVGDADDDENVATVVVNPDDKDEFVYSLDDVNKFFVDKSIFQPVLRKRLSS